MHQPPAQKRDQYAHTWQRAADVGRPQKTAGVSKRDCENDSSARHLHVVHCGEECPNHLLKQKMTTAHERKPLKYIKLAAKCQEAGWNLACGGRLYIAGFVGKTTVQLLHGVGVVGLSLRKATKVLGEEAEKEKCTGGCTGLEGKTSRNSGFQLMTLQLTYSNGIRGGVTGYKAEAGDTTLPVQ